MFFYHSARNYVETLIVTKPSLDNLIAQIGDHNFEHLTEINSKDDLVEFVNSISTISDEQRSVCDLIINFGDESLFPIFAVSIKAIVTKSKEDNVQIDEYIAFIDKKNEMERIAAEFQLKQQTAIDEEFNDMLLKYPVLRSEMQKPVAKYVAPFLIETDGAWMRYVDNTNDFTKWINS